MFTLFGDKFSLLFLNNFLQLLVVAEFCPRPFYYLLMKSYIFHLKFIDVLICFCLFLDVSLLVP